ncbi:hypothetical protein ACLOJK_013482 [Asimina triloba]
MAEMMFHSPVRDSKVIPLLTSPVSAGNSRPGSSMGLVLNFEFFLPSYTPRRDFPSVVLEIDLVAFSVFFVLLHAMAVLVEAWVSGTALNPAALLAGPTFVPVPIMLGFCSTRVCPFIPIELYPSIEQCSHGSVLSRAAFLI